VLGKTGKPSLASSEGQDADEVTSTQPDRFFEIGWLILMELGRKCLYVAPIDSVDEALAGGGVFGPFVVGEIHCVVGLQ